MKTVAIIGVGLMGGSLGLALRRHAGRYRVVGLGRDEQKLQRARRAGALDACSLDWQQGLAGADIVVVCTPVAIIEPTIKRILPWVSDGAVITDVGDRKSVV
jgi:prephenate dehydrogenase